MKKLEEKDRFRSLSSGLQGRLGSTIRLRKIKLQNTQFNFIFVSAKQNTSIQDKLLDVPGSSPQLYLPIVVAAYGKTVWCTDVTPISEHLPWAIAGAVYGMAPSHGSYCYTSYEYLTLPLMDNTGSTNK